MKIDIADNAMELILEILGCDIDDLKILSDSEADMSKIVADLTRSGSEISLKSVMAEIFDEGISRMDQAVHRIVEELESKEKDNSLSQEDSKMLNAIRENSLDPLADFWYNFNFLDTHLRCNSEVIGVYNEFFDKELKALMDYTGFDVEE